MAGEFGCVDIGTEFEEEKFQEICKMIDEGKYVSFYAEGALKKEFAKAIKPYCTKLKEHYGDQLDDLRKYLEAGVIIKISKKKRKRSC